MKKDIFDALQNDVMSANLSEKERKQMLKNIMKLKNQKINIMITGPTGCGKSSTINALFDTEVAKVGVGTDPETMCIEKYQLDNLVIWDTPGLGDGREADRKHTEAIIRKLNEVDSNGNALIDLVLVILDGGSRDLGTSYDLINNVIIPNLGQNKKDRILVAINQADVAMKGRYWNFDRNEPEEQLVEFLENKVVSVKNRIFEATGIDVDPIYFCAGYKEDGEMQNRPYNLSKLLYYIVNHTPAEKRFVYANNLNDDEEMWGDDDRKNDYNRETKRSIIKSIVDGATAGARIGSAIGSVFGGVGRCVGGLIGGAIGGFGGGFLGFFS